MEIELFKKRFGERVREARRRRGISQEELAARIERSSDMVSNLERGASSTRMETALRIAEVLDTTILDLVDVDQVGPKDRHTRDLVNRLLDLVGAESEDFLAAVISQVEVLLRIRAESAERK